jgi:hypothetical protein
VEVSRKHGPFDTRWPRAYGDGSSAEPALSLRAEEMTEALDWDAFSGRHFAERSRHDSQARSAYAAYKQGREWRTGPAELRLVPTEPDSATDESEPHEAGTRRLLAAVTAFDPNARIEEGS